MLLVSKGEISMVSSLGASYSVDEMMRAMLRRRQLRAFVKTFAKLRLVDQADVEHIAWAYTRPFGKDVLGG
jgi:hypothetical protein